MKPILLFFIIVYFLATSCRSHKESAVAESSFVEVASTAHVNEKLTNVSDTKLNSSISFDSIEIFIQRNWNSSYSDEDKFSSVWHGLSNPEFMATSDSMRISSKSMPMAPYSEIIGIKAYNAKAASSTHSQDSISSSTDSALAIDLSMESQKEESDTSDSVAVFDPPDVLSVVIWSFSIAAAILIIVYFIKRKSNP
ncbi:MAG: hypothetical protein J1E16_05730 [Muribaculaceae bacterium]|nr:hypothetical protein [Muribaculaceae bacterium]